MLLGLTGSIASGKSAVTARLRQLGAYVQDADEVSRELYAPGSSFLQRIAELFGMGVLREDGTLDRRALAGIVFHDTEKLQELNELAHPAIIGRMHERAEAYLLNHPERTAVLDMALLIETGDYKNVDEVWLVTAPDEVRLRRIMLRDGCDEVHARARMAAQMPQAEKIAFADRVIENSGTLTELYEKVDGLYREIHGRRE